VARDGQRPERSGDDVNDNPSCCTPQFSTSQSAGSRVPVRPDRGSYSIEQCSIRAGVFAMGDAQGDGKRGDGEGPVLNVELDAFTIDATSVTNAAFVNTGEDGWITTTAVRSYSPNAFGLWQTVGNVWEWCQDVFNARAYAAAPVRNPCTTPNSLLLTVPGCGAAPTCATTPTATDTAKQPGPPTRPTPPWATRDSGQWPDE
jgi:formylglycine-generating enzyme required for sulfatase activity